MCTSFVVFLLLHNLHLSMMYCLSLETSCCQLLLFVSKRETTIVHMFASLHQNIIPVELDDNLTTCQYPISTIISLTFTHLTSIGSQVFLTTISTIEIQ